MPVLASFAVHVSADGGLHACALRLIPLAPQTPPAQPLGGGGVRDAAARAPAAPPSSMLAVGKYGGSLYRPGAR